MRYDVYYLATGPLAGLIIHLAEAGTSVGRRMVPPNILSIQIEFLPEDTARLATFTACGGTEQQPTWTLISRWRFTELPSAPLTREQFWEAVTDRVPVAESLYTLGITLRR